MTYGVGIFVFENVEVLDFAGPYEVFTCASRMYNQNNDVDSLFNVFTIAASTTILHARAGLTVLPDYQFSSHPDIDVVIIPGGVVVEELDKDSIIQWIAKTAAQSAITASVCTGAFLLAKAGLLHEKSATTHWEDTEELQHMFPDIHVLRDRRWVDLGNIVTSGGISAGIDMSLHIVEKLAGRALAERTARQMEFDWTET